MNKFITLVVLISAVVVNGERSSPGGGEPARLNDAIIAKYGETPCLNRVIGQRLSHPTDPHKFLRCMSLESLWIETCPDGLFYNPSQELCDWSTKPRASTKHNEVVKNRPVLFKTKLTEAELINDVQAAAAASIAKHSEDQVDSSIATPAVADQRQQQPSTTPSLLDELRKKLNLDQDRSSGVDADEVVSSTRRQNSAVITAQSDSPISLPEDAAPAVVPKNKMRIIDSQDSNDSSGDDFVLQSSTRRSGFLKSAGSNDRSSLSF
jgi:hypothetical protein